MATAQIEFFLSQLADVRLSIIDVLGRTVAAIVDAVMPEGKHSVMFDASALPAGVYMCRINAEGIVEVKRMSVVR